MLRYFPQRNSLAVCSSSGCFHRLERRACRSGESPYKFQSLSVSHSKFIKKVPSGRVISQSTSAFWLPSRRKRICCSSPIKKMCIRDSPKTGEHHREQSRQPSSGCAGPAVALVLVFRQWLARHIRWTVALTALCDVLLFWDCLLYTSVIHNSITVKTHGGCSNETDYFKCIWRPHIRAD